MASKIRVAASDRSVDHRANEAHLKQRVKELEDEVLSLKRRLDELRKAKNTTVLKREREVLEVGAPFGRRDSKPGIDDKEFQRRLSEKMADKDRHWQSELDALRKKFAAEMDEIRRSSSAAKDCGHETELTFLRQRNEELENDNVALTSQNRELRERVDALLSDLSVKEASWCEMEEKFKLEIKRSWGEKYKKWMEDTEAKIEELQRTNALLRTYLKKQRPEGADPSRQDPDYDNL